MTVQAVIFGMDGLMFDCAQISRRAFYKALAACRLSAEESLFERLAGADAAQTEALLKRALKTRVPVPRILRLWQLYTMMIIETEGITTKPGLYELLEGIEHMHLKKAIACPHHPEQIACSLRAAGLGAAFETVITPIETAARALNPEIFLRTAEALAVAPQNCIVLEDSPLGVEAAARANMPVILVPDSACADGRQSGRARAVVHDLREAWAFIKQAAA